MRPPLAAFVLLASLCSSLLQLGATAHPAPRKIPKFEIKISGPACLGPNYSLESQWFTALLTNRSAEPQVLFVCNGYLMNARWDWTVTDAKGEYMSMAFVNRGFCGTMEQISEEAEAEARRIRDKDLVVLAPGESREFAIPGPSDDYNFPKAGTYRLAVTLTYVPPNAEYYFDEQGKRQKVFGPAQWDLSTLSVDGLREVLNSLSVHATSSVWNLMLTSARTHPDAAFIGNVLVIPAQR